MGVTIGDITSRRGRVAELGDKNGFKYILAYLPLDEMFGYTTQLRSMTQGRGFYSKSFSHYETVPTEVARKIIDASKNAAQTSTE